MAAATRLTQYLKVSDNASAAAVRLSLNIACQTATLRDVKEGSLTLVLPVNNANVAGHINLSEMISATAKLIQQKKSSQLLYLFGCLFNALSTLPAKTSLAAMSSVKQLLSSFGTAVLRYGGFLFVDAAGQKLIVSVCLLLRTDTAVFKRHVGPLPCNAFALFFRSAAPPAGYTAPGSADEVECAKVWSTLDTARVDRPRAMPVAL